MRRTSNVNLGNVLEVVALGSRVGSDLSCSTAGKHLASDTFNSLDEVFRHGNVVLVIGLGQSQRTYGNMVRVAGGFDGEGLAGVLGGCCDSKAAHAEGDNESSKRLHIGLLIKYFCDDLGDLGFR